ELVPAILDRTIEIDLDRLPALGFEVRQEPRLMLEPALPEDVQLRIIAHRALHQPGKGRSLELGQMLAGQVGDEVGGGVDGPTVDRLHARTLAGTRDSLPVTASLSRRNDQGGDAPCAPRSRPSEAARSGARARLALAAPPRQF